MEENCCPILGCRIEYTLAFGLSQVECLLRLSDTSVYETQIRARFGITAQLCKVVVFKSRVCRIDYTLAFGLTAQLCEVALCNYVKQLFLIVCNRLLICVEIDLTIRGIAYTPYRGISPHKKTATPLGLS